MVQKAEYNGQVNIIAGLLTLRATDYPVNTMLFRKFMGEGLEER